MLVPQKQQLTTQSAANFLGFSRPPYQAPRILHYSVHQGRQHRRVLLKDVLTLQKSRDVQRRALLNDPAKTELDLGLYEGSAIPDGGSDE